MPSQIASTSSSFCFCPTAMRFSHKSRWSWTRSSLCLLVMFRCLFLFFPLLRGKTPGSSKMPTRPAPERSLSQSCAPPTFKTLKTSCKRSALIWCGAPNNFWYFFLFSSQRTAFAISEREVAASVFQSFYHFEILARAMERARRCLALR